MKQHLKTVLVLTLSIILITAGIISNQPKDVYNKAIRICLECVGIG